LDTGEIDAVARSMRVCGADWSGAQDAGRRIWIAEGEWTASGLVLKRVLRAENLPGSARARERCLVALRAWIDSLGPCALGMDFPFGLPAQLMGENDWLAFILDFPDRFPDPLAFRDWCRRTASDRELKRRTDLLTRTPFCPYNLRMFRQTYWGMAGLLAPLVAQSAVAVLPMQEPRTEVPWLLETCPASTLKRLGLYGAYKGPGGARRAARCRILEMLVRDRHLIRPRQALGELLLGDPGGDALDAALAAVAVSKALRHRHFPRPDWEEIYAREACVYA
jgi:hypothetical protein